MSLLHPPALRPGDPLYVVSPAGPVIPANLAEGLAVLRELDLDVVLDTDQVYRRRPPYDYMAGDDEARFRAFQEAWDQPGPGAILCSRGGYGVMRWLQRLDPEILRRRPRLVIGFSDITALHLYLSGPLGIATVHGPVLKSLRLHTDDRTGSLEAFRRALFAEGPGPAPFAGLRCLRGGEVTGPVFGGNLTLLISLLGTPFCPNLDGAIVVLEDVGEPDYRLDRLLTSLRLACPGLGGVVLGEFLGCDGVYVSAEELDPFLTSLSADFHCPVVAGAPVGHGSVNHAFPMGVEATLDADNGTLTFSSHAALALPSIKDHE